MRHSRGLKRCQSEVWGRGSRAGRQVGSDRAPHLPPQHTLSWRGVERVAWTAGQGGQPPVPNPPRRPRAAAQTLQRVKFPVARGAGDTARPGGSQPGAPVRANFRRPVGTWGRVAGAASVALCLGGRLRFGFDVCESSGRLRRRAVDSCVL